MAIDMNRILYLLSKTVLIICIIIFSKFAYSQNINNSSKRYLIKADKKYLVSYFQDTKDAIKFPFRLSSKQWLFAGGISLAGVFVYSQDEQIRNYFQKNHSKGANDFSKHFCEPFGSGLYSLPLLAGFFSYGAIAKDSRAKFVALTGLKAFVISTGFTQVIKQLTHRHRPDQNNLPNPKIWDGPFSDIEYTSFPSGHSAAIFSIATVIASEYNDTFWVPIVSYTIAGLASVSRIYDDEHWASDVFFGAILGYAIGKLVYNNSGKRFTFSPVSSSGGFGFSVIYSLK